MTQITEAQKEIWGALLKQVPVEERPSLLNQLNRLKCTRCEMTSAGAYYYYSISQDALAAGSINGGSYRPGAELIMNGGISDLGVVGYVNSGKIEMLEIFTYDNDIPANWESLVKRVEINKR